MKRLAEQDIRNSFLNCTKGEAKRLNLPRDLAEQPWDDLDFLGWRDQQAPDRAYLVTELNGRPQGLVLRSPAAAAWQARRAGAGRGGDSGRPDAPGRNATRTPTASPSASR